MKAVTKLKDDARRHELREDWEKAIQVYLQVVRIGEQGETDLELPLYNRIGDLYVRVGKPEDAVIYYEQAADRYAEAGLFNNAIALCNKALRYAPDHLELIRKLGQFSASQGFLTDARRWFLDFAERASKQGRTDEALSALEDFANTAEDAEVRELLGRRLHQHGREEDAITELRRAYRMYLGEGREAKADNIREFLAEAAPAVSLAEEEPELPARRDRVAEDYGVMDGAGAEPEPAVAAPEAAVTVPVEEDSDVTDAPLEGLLPTAAGEADVAVDDADVLEGFEATSFDTAPEDEHAPIDLPDLEATGAESLEEVDETETAFDLPSLDATELEPTSLEPTSLDETEADLEGMPSLEGELEPLSTLEEEEAETEIELPLLHQDGDVTPDAEPAPMFEVDDAGEVVEDALRAARAAMTMGDVADAVEQLHALHARIDDSAAFADVTREVDALLSLAPDEIRLHQVRVEFAERSHDRTLRLHSYLDLARALERTNARQKAAAMYEHVLEIDPGNADARAALARAAAPPQPDYVDLKALLDLDEPTGQTRYFVEETEPTGDEDNDFAAILSQFKAKLAEHVAPEDASAHYDLGIAFKEMGLVDEAIAEFQVAMRAGDGRLKIYEELGHCFLLKEQYTVAAKVLARGLEMPSTDEVERIGVYYHLGRACEQLGRIDEARDAYERVMGLDITFRDVAARLKRL